MMAIAEPHDAAHRAQVPAGARERTVATARPMLQPTQTRPAPGLADPAQALQAARAQLDAARHGVKAAEREGLPSIDLSWNHYENGRPDQNLAGAPRRERSAAITLRIPLFDGYAQTYRVRAAQAQVAQRQAEVDAAEAQVRKEVHFVYTEAQAALSNLQAARQLALAAREATESVQRKFDRGAADLQQLTPALTALTRARAELAQSWAQWQAASLRLHIQAGPATRNED